MHVGYDLSGLLILTLRPFELGDQIVHGGRTLDTASPTAIGLPLIRRAVGTDLAILVDGAIRRGTDVLKGIALGANAVLCRPALCLRAG